MCASDLILNFEFQGQRSKVKGQGHDISRNAQIKITKTGISQSIFKLEQNLKNHNVILLEAYLHGIINSGITSGLKVRLTSKWRPFWKFRNILDKFILTLDMERPSKINPKKLFWKLMTSLMTSQRDVKVGLLYSCLNEIVTFSAIQVTVFD